MSEIYPWQQDDWIRLQSLRQRSTQGLLLKGGKGIGKMDLAQNYAKSLLCQHPAMDGYACGECASCHWFDQGTHPDLRILQPESETDEAEDGKKPSKQIAVDQIRGLTDFLGMSAHQGGRRVVIIHPAEAMNTNATNALLKSLEEPPAGLLFILVSHKSQQLLPTLLSRCLVVSLAVPDAASATRWLVSKGVKNPEDVLASAGFSPLLALQNAAEKGMEMRDKLLRGVKQPATLDVFALADSLQKTEQVLVVQWLQQWSHDLISLKLTGSLRYHLNDEAVIRELVSTVDPVNLTRLQKYLQTAKREAQHTLNPKLFFESLLLVYCQLMRP